MPLHISYNLACLNVFSENICLRMFWQKTVYISNWQPNKHDSPLMDNTYPLLTQITEQRFKSWPENRTTVVRWTDVCLVSIKEAGHHLIRPDFQLISCKRYLILGKSETNQSFDDVDWTKKNWRLLLHLSRVGFAATTILLTRPGVRPTVHLHHPTLPF